MHRSIDVRQLLRHEVDLQWEPRQAIVNLCISASLWNSVEFVSLRTDRADSSSLTTILLQNALQFHNSSHPNTMSYLLGQRVTAPKAKWA
jgi:hypothetical protein